MFSLLRSESKQAVWANIGVVGDLRRHEKFAWCHSYTTYLWQNNGEAHDANYQGVPLQPRAEAF